MAEGFKALFGGGGASAEARKSQRLQDVANQRQLAQLQAEDRRTIAPRRNPRGRRLFADDSSLKDTLA